MNSKREPVVELAIAIIQRAVTDAKSSEDRKRDVKWCLDYGALPYWIDVVADKYEVAEELEAGLRNLVS